MSESTIDRLVRAVLYEGYILYPYRRGTKNMHRWTFGGVFPRDSAGSERSEISTQVLVRGNGATKFHAMLKFLQLVDRKVDPHDGLIVAGKQYQDWQDAIERGVCVDGIGRKVFSFPAERNVEPLRETDGRQAGALVRTQAAIDGTIEIAAESLGENLIRLTARAANISPADEQSPQSRAMMSCNIVLQAEAGEFISSIDPPADLKAHSKQLKNAGVWPVLVGDAGAADTMLAAPIILYDYPQIAPESPGDLFDGTEIDEILSLRIMTLTDEEKRAAADLDPRTAAMLQRTQSLAREQMSRLHGTMRQISARPVSKFRTGDRVRLRPKRSADAFDIILAGKIATIVAIEQDFEDRIHLAVTIDDDPGADIGAAGKIGHRFFFGVDEVEPATT